MLHERAYAKVNLVLLIGRQVTDGRHPVCSLFASIDLADDVTVAPAGDSADSVESPGVEGPNLALAAVAALRERIGPAVPPLRVVITKHIPVAAGLAGGSADAAAVLRMANRLAGAPLGAEGLREVADGLGSDVPSQIEPRHALVQGTGELVEPIELPPLGLLLVVAEEGLSTGAVYAELDRVGAGRERLDPQPLRRLAAAGAAAIGAGLENDLQAPALRLRPELAGTLERIRAAGALGAAVSGSGPTCFGVFEDRETAARAAASSGLAGAVVTGLRSG